MLKKYLISLTLLSFFHASIICSQDRPTHHAKSSALTNKDQKFILLNKIAEHINRLAPLDEYTVTVPPFFIVTDKDVYQLLASIPSQSHTPSETHKKRLRASKTTSMLDQLEQAWKSVRSSLKRGKATAKTYKLLNNMRDIIDAAFNVEHITFINKEFTAFLDKTKHENTPLIARMATDHPTLGPKSIYPVDAASVYRAIGDTLKTYYYDTTIDHLIKQGALPTNIYATIILQQFITQNNNADPLVSGFCCSQDRVSGATNIAVLEAVYGHHEGFKHEMVTPDTYYVHNDTVIPIIRKKEQRLQPNLEGIYTSINKNNDKLVEAPTLDAHAAQEIAKATLLLAQYNNSPVCISFIKQHNTIYLIDFHHLPEISTAHATFIDPLYIKKAIKDGAIHIKSLKPLYHVIAIKKPEQILFATDFSDLLHQYETSSNPDDIMAGVITKKISPWSKEQKIIESLPFVTLWSSSPENIQRWIKQRAWPLIVDPQTQLMFPYKRRKNFCTLFQIVISGLQGYPLPEQISMLDSFFAPISMKQKDLLNPNEFFSGVSIGYLFELLKNEHPETALQALRTILYRLKARIKRASLMLTQKDSNTIDPEKQIHLQALEKQYERIAAIGYKLYTIMHHNLKAGKQQSTQSKELLFLIDVFQKMISQIPDNTTVKAVSFNTLLEQVQ